MIAVSGYFYSALAAISVGFLAVASLAARADAHEVLPSIADFSVSMDEMIVTVRLDIEALIAGMDLSSPTSDRKA